MTFRPVDQETNGCWVACLASITAIPLSEFPTPPGGNPPWSAEEDCVYHNATMAVLHRNGWTVADLGTRMPVEGYAVASGPSPRAADGSKTWHAVVWKDGEIVFDPHYTREALGGAPPQWFEIVVRIQPFENAAA